MELTGTLNGTSGWYNINNATPSRCQFILFLFPPQVNMQEVPKYQISRAFLAIFGFCTGRLGKETVCILQAGKCSGTVLEKSQIMHRCKWSCAHQFYLSCFSHVFYISVPSFSKKDFGSCSQRLFKGIVTHADCKQKGYFPDQHQSDVLIGCFGSKFSKPV